jgi:predicted exporter
VQWVDRVAQMSGLLKRYREAMSWLLAGGFVLVGLLLYARFRNEAWRAWMPTLLATLLTLAALRLLGEPLQLFHVLALFIVLGIGVDYGIFLVEHQSDGAAWLSVVLGAASTWLSFGLLAASGTPALHAFGLTMALGIGSVALLSPLFRPLPPRSATTGSHSKC